MEKTTLYAVVVFEGDDIVVYKTTEHKRMADKVREVAAARKPYTVLQYPGYDPNFGTQPQVWQYYS